MVEFYERGASAACFSGSYFVSVLWLRDNMQISYVFAPVMDMLSVCSLLFFHVVPSPFRPVGYLRGAMVAGPHRRTWGSRSSTSKHERCYSNRSMQP